MATTDILQRAKLLVKQADSPGWASQNDFLPPTLFKRMQESRYAPTEPSGQAWDTDQSFGRGLWNTFKAPFKALAAPLTAAFSSDPSLPGVATSGIGAAAEAAFNPELFYNPKAYAKNLWSSTIGAPFNPKSRYSLGVQRQMGDAQFEFKNSLPTAFSNPTGLGADWIHSYGNMAKYHPFTPGYGHYSNSMFPSLLPGGGPGGGAATHSFSFMHPPIE